MDRKKVLWNLIFIVIIFSAMMYFLLPHYEFIPKLLYFTIAVGFGVWHFLQRNLRAAVMCGLGALFVLLTLPNNGILKQVELVVLAVAWGVAFYLFKRSNGDAS